MKVYGRIGNLRLLKIRVVLNDTEVICEGMVEDAPDEVKELEYSKIEMSEFANLYVYSS